MCKCDCDYCSPSGCSHGTNPDSGLCSHFSCKRCVDVQCKHEWNDTFTSWVRPAQIKRKGGGLYWHDQLYRGTRTDLMKSAKDEMMFFTAHDEAAKQHKLQISHLMENIPLNSIIAKADFIQNIVHDRGTETSQVHFFFFTFQNGKLSYFLLELLWKATNTAACIHCLVSSTWWQNQKIVCRLPLKLLITQFYVFSKVLVSSAHLHGRWNECCVHKGILSVL